MKKIIYLTILGLFFTGSVAYAAGVLQVIQGGTGATTLTGCLEGNGTSAITGTGLPCGSGGGGSGGGTWATTTSTVTGRLINYPLNTTDIVVIGGTATTTGATEYWFDPNTQNAHIGSSNTASTTIMGLLFLPTNSQGSMYIGSNGQVQTVSTSTPTVGTGLSYSGTLGQFIGGSSGSLTCATANASTFGCLTGAKFSQFDSATTTAGTGLTYSGNAFNVNTSQNISTLSNLTSNGAILTSGGTGALSIYSGTSCTNQFVRSLSGSIVATCATVANTDLANSSITINGLSVSLGGSITVASTTLLSDLNNWTKRQDFSNSSTSLGSFVYSSSTNLFAGTITIPNLAVPAGSFIAVNASGQIIATTSPTGGSGTPAGSNGQLQYNASGVFGGVSTTTASCTGSVSCTGFTIIGSSPITITGSGGSGGGLGTTTPWTYGNIVTAITDGNVTTISTSTLVNNIFPFNSFGNSTSSIFNFTNGLMAFSSTTLNGLKLSDLSQGALYVGSGAKVSSTATSTQTVGSSLSYTGTQGSMLGGSSGTLSLNTANPNTWSVLQTFNYSSSTAYSSFLTASSTFYQGAGLSTCNSASSALTWSGGTFGCNSITGGSGASPDWQKITDPFNVTALTPTTTIPLYIQGTATSSFAGKMVIGSSTGSYANCFLCVTGKENSFMQFNIQNLSGGSSASSDIVATADVGTDNKYYLNTGINGSGGASTPFTTALEGYLYTSDSALNIGALGTTSSSAILKFYTGSSTTTPTERLRITSTGSLVLATTTKGILRTDSSGTIYASSGTTTLPLFNGFINPDTGGNSWIQPSIINAPASIYGGMVYIASSTSAKTGFYGSIHIPSNFASSTSQISIGWTATSTSNSVVFDFDYRCVGGTNTTSLYQTSWQESTTTTVTNPSTAGFRKLTTLDINTGYWCTPDSTMEFYVARDGADSADTSTVDLEIYDASILLPTQ